MGVGLALAAKLAPCAEVQTCHRRNLLGTIQDAWIIPSKPWQDSAMTGGKLRTALIIVAVAFASCLSQLSAVASTPVVGRTIDDFTLNDHLGAKRSLAEWKDAKAVVVVFLGTECPLAKLYATKLAELEAKYGSQCVQFVGRNANTQENH